MIGLLFFGAIILWMGVAIYLAIRLPRWFNFKDRWGLLIAPMVFFIPVIDEVIALPQAYLLCQQAEDDFWYDPSIKGGVLSYSSTTLSRVDEKVGINIQARLIRSAHVIKSSGMPAIKDVSVDFSAGLLFNTLWGVNGKPVILPESCPSRYLATTRYQSIIKLLELSRADSSLKCNTST